MARGARRMAQHRRPVARRLGVKRHPRVIAAPQRTKSIQDAGMHADAAMRGDRLLHRQPRDLMPEPQSLSVHSQQARRQQLVENRQRARRDRRQQIQLHAGAGQRRNIQHTTGLAAQPRRPRQHRIARRRRDGTNPACTTSVT